jgi:hypothetical protein
MGQAEFRLTESPFYKLNGDHFILWWSAERMELEGNRKKKIRLEKQDLLLRKF